MKSDMELGVAGALDLDVKVGAIIDSVVASQGECIAPALEGAS
jgi:hypothetical protein